MATFPLFFAMLFLALEALHFTLEFTKVPLQHHPRVLDALADLPVEEFDGFMEAAVRIFDKGLSINPWQFFDVLGNIPAVERNGFVRSAAVVLADWMWGDARDSIAGYLQSVPARERQEFAEALRIYCTYTGISYNFSAYLEQVVKALLRVPAADRVEWMMHVWNLPVMAPPLYQETLERLLVLEDDSMQGDLASALRAVAGLSETVYRAIMAVPPGMRRTAVDVASYGARKEGGSVLQWLGRHGTEAWQSCLDRHTKAKWERQQALMRIMVK